jgi:hypothetical protein
MSRIADSWSSGLIDTWRALVIVKQVIEVQELSERYRDRLLAVVGVA